MDKKDYCCYCKTDLTDKNSVGGSFICIDCQKQIYRELEARNGCHIAIFLTCASVNLPCLPEIAPKNIEEKEDSWQAYIDALSENDKLEKRDRFATFFDGIADMRKIFGSELSQEDFTKYIVYENKIAKSLTGTPEQRERWGQGELCRGLEFTDELYNDLDAQYEIWVGRYKGQTITPPLEQSIITICKRNKVIDFLIEQGLYVDASKVQAMVENLMASEQMRKKDEKPVENFMPDAWISAFEKSGYMENGDFKTIPEIEEALIEAMKRKGYDGTLDVVYQLEKNILNHQRINDDKQTIFDLPETMAINDHLGQMAKEESAEEKHRKKYAKMPPVTIRKGRKNADG